MKQVSYIGFNSISALKDLVEKGGFRNILLVHDNQSYALCGAEEKLAWMNESCSVVEFSDFELNPKIEDVDRGVSLFKENDIDCIIAVGGGSVIDMAKLINWFSANDLNSQKYLIEDQNSVEDGKVLIAVPTTSGTGSEGTHFAVFYVDKVKHSAAHETILPDLAIIDPNLSSSQPPYISAASGMDALSQAIESYWSIYSTDESQKYSKKAIELILPNLKQSVVAPTPESRLAMAEAAYLAGKSINITKTTAPHAVSYPITSYFGIAHGHAVALILPSIFEFNGLVDVEDVSDQRGEQYVRKTIDQLLDLLGLTTLYSVKEFFDTLMEEIGLKTKLSDLRINTDEDIELIIKNGFNPDRVRNNPRILTEFRLRKMLLRIR
jgi:alcohol dehydrogenase class IV